MKNYSNKLFFLALISLSACQAQTPTAKGNTMTTATDAVTLNATACYGTCPIYEITLHANGQVDFEGKGYTGHQGKAQRQVSPELAKDILQALEVHRPKAGTTAKNAVCKRRATDHPSYILTWREKTGEPTIYRHYSGCSGAENRIITEQLKGIAGRLNLLDLIRYKRKVKRLSKPDAPSS